MKNAIITILAALALAGAAFAELPANSGKPWTPEQEHTLKDAAARGESVEQIAKALQRTPKSIAMKAEKLGLTPPTGTSTVAAATSSPAPVAAVTPTPNPHAKKILVGAYSFNQVDLALIEALKSKGFEIVTTGPGDITTKQVEVTWADKSKPPVTTRTATGKIKADFKNGTFPVETLGEYCAYIFPDTDNARSLKLPMDQILRSGKLVVLGEVPNVAAGEKLLIANVGGRYTPNTYDLATGIDRISYVVFASSWKQKKFPTEKDNAAFVEKLEAEIVRGL